MTDTLSKIVFARKAYQDQKSEHGHGTGRMSVAAFGAVVVVAFPLMLWCERGTWFQLDDWDFLAARTGGNVGDLFRAHNQHWVTLPIVAYRLLWQVFGLHTARPYQALLIVGHLGIAAL